MNPHEEMIISALRYALPRGSYIMDDTEEYVRKMLEDGVSNNFVRVCIKDIEGYHQDMKNLHITANVLRHDWTPLLETLKNYL